MSWEALAMLMINATVAVIVVLSLMFRPDDFFVNLHRTLALLKNQVGKRKIDGRGLSHPKCTTSNRRQTCVTEQALDRGGREHLEGKMNTSANGT